jgi:hypothetical protein
LLIIPSYHKRGGRDKEREREREEKERKRERGEMGREGEGERGDALFSTQTIDHAD